MALLSNENITEEHTQSDIIQPLHETGQIGEMTSAEAHHEFQEFSFPDYILGSNVLNFIIVVLFVVWVVKKVNIAKMIDKKRSEVIETIRSAEKEKIDSEKHLLDTQTKVRNVDIETSQIIEEGKETAAKLFENISKSAKQQTEDMQKKAELSVENQKAAVTKEVTSKVTKAAFYIAEDHIKKSIDERLHRKFINEFIDNLDKAENLAGR